MATLPVDPRAESLPPFTQPAHGIEPRQINPRTPGESSAEAFQRIFGGVQITWSPGLGEAYREAAADSVLLVGADFDRQMAAFAAGLQACMNCVSGERR